MGRPKMSEEEKLAARQKREELNKTIMQSYEENPTLDTSNEPLSEIVQKIEGKELPLEEFEMNSISYGMAQDLKTGQWFGIKIMFDLESGTSSGPIKIGEGDIKAIARERMLIEQANKIFGD